MHPTPLDPSLLHKLHVRNIGDQIIVGRATAGRGCAPSLPAGYISTPLRKNAGNAVTAEALPYTTKVLIYTTIKTTRVSVTEAGVAGWAWSLHGK